MPTLLQLAEALSLEVANLHAEWSRGVPAVASAVSTMPYMGSYNMGSDHNRIKLTLITSAHHKVKSKHRKHLWRYVLKAEPENIAEEF